MTENAVEAVGLSKKFLMAAERRTSFKERFVRGRAPEPKTFWALKDATFSVPKGSSLGIIGHNGSGKSTALKVLTGIYRPTSGTVKVNGSVSALLEVGAGFHPELTGRENVRLNATILGFTNREIDRFMDQIIEFADIGDHIDAPIKHYSSGMHVRLGFAVAVMVRPEILIVDEVIAVGDEEFQRKCYDYLYDLRRAGTSMIIVSHGLGQITDLCDEAVWLERGEMRGIGLSRQVVRSYLDFVNEREVARSQVVMANSEAEGMPAPDHFESVSEVGEDAAGEVDHRVTSSAHSPPRIGSGEIRVTGVEFIDPKGRPSGVFISGQPSTLRIHYSATSDMDDVYFGFGVFDQTDLPICGVNSAATGTWSIKSGCGHVDFDASPWLTASGKYSVRVMIKASANVVDAIDIGLGVVVREAAVETAGTFLQPGSWSLAPE